MFPFFIQCQVVKKRFLSEDLTFPNLGSCFKVVGSALRS